MQEKINDLLKWNGVTEPHDMLHVGRSLTRTLRCHALPVSRNGTVAEHSFNCMLLADYLHFNGLINPSINSGQLQALKDTLMYHDIEESLMGDIPAFVAEEVTKYSNTARAFMSGHFIKNSMPLDEIYKLSKQIDMLDFLLNMLDEPTSPYNTYNNARINKAIDNATESLTERVSKSFHKIDFVSILKRYRK